MSNSVCDNNAVIVSSLQKQTSVPFFDVFFSLYRNKNPNRCQSDENFVTQQVQLGRQLHPGSGVDLVRGQGDQNILQVVLWKAKDGGWLFHWLLPAVVFFFFFFIQDLFRLHRWWACRCPLRYPCTAGTAKLLCRESFFAPTNSANTGEAKNSTKTNKLGWFKIIALLLFSTCNDLA